MIQVNERCRNPDDDALKFYARKQDWSGAIDIRVAMNAGTAPS